LNRAKARAASQPCGVLVSPDGAAFSHLSLTDAARDFAEWAASVELVNLLAQVKDTAPGWLRSAAVQGYVGLSMAWHPRLLALAVEFDHLYVSSANQTSQPAAVTAREAEAAFAGRLLVLDGDRFRDQTREHGSAMMLQIHRTGEARVIRHGVQDRWCPDPVTYVRWLRSRYRSST
jgi:tRNA A37 threonylcarbamoyladenosine synthetase subunit TsaC/SUA5/YrdC